MAETLSDKVIFITGSTDGLGKLVAKHLAMQGATILLHGRNPEKGKQALDELTKSTKSDKIKYYNADYSNFKEVKLLGDQILQEHKCIDILINNAGIGSGKNKNERKISQDGIELRFAVNYFAHVLLTEKLIPILPPATAKIINVASVGQEPVKFHDLMLEKDYDGLYAYRQAKTALIMYTFDLAERLKDKKIKVNAIHPASLMNTKMVLESWAYTLSTVEQGAEATENMIYVETTGQYYDGKRISKAILQAYDLESRLALKNITWKFLENFL